VLIRRERVRLMTVDRYRRRILALALAGVVVGASVTPFPSAGAAASVPNVYLVGAGDIASCKSLGDEQTAALLDQLKGTVFTTGDNAYGRGTPWQFRNCYGPSWGRHKSRTKPSPGNHEYLTEDAAGYFDYFGDAAGTPGRGWYAFERGAWRIYALNSNCDEIGGCWVGSAQERWLRADLAAHPHDCVLAYWHHPRFSSGEHGNQPAVRGLWRTLYAAGAEIVVNGHDHNYERFAPQDWQGTADPVGIREFVVGTGGRSLYTRATVQPNSEAWNETTFGIIKLVLADGWYRWRFMAVDSSQFSDTGVSDCH
jgi:hypothetical protein